MRLSRLEMVWRRGRNVVGGGDEPRSTSLYHHYIQSEFEVVTCKFMQKFSNLMGRAAILCSRFYLSDLLMVHAVSLWATQQSS